MLVYHNIMLSPVDTIPLVLLMFLASVVVSW